MTTETKCIHGKQLHTGCEECQATYDRAVRKRNARRSGALLELPPRPPKDAA